MRIHQVDCCLLKLLQCTAEALVFFGQNGAGDDGGSLPTVRGRRFG